jgi:cell cycle sensor histidine kinase DivJ
LSIFSRFEHQALALLHQGLDSGLADTTRQHGLMLPQLVMSFAACAVAPFYLAFHGAPALWQTLAFIWAMAPLAGVAIVWRTGKPAVAHAISSFTFIAVGVTLAIGGGGSYQAALCWLILAPLQAILTANRSLILASGSCAVLAGFGLAILHSVGLLSIGFALTDATIFLIPAILYATVLALGTARVHALQNTVARLHANRYQAISRAVGDVIVCFDPSGSAEYISPDCETLLGLRRPDLIGRGFFEHIHVGDRPNFLKAVADATRSSDRISTNLRLRTVMPAAEDLAAAVPMFLWMEMHVRQFTDTTDEFSGSGHVSIAAILHDITKAKQREEELEASRAAAERVSQSKDQFLANMSHELRTPLNAIIGFSEMLSNSELAPKEPGKQQEYASIIQQSGLHLLSVVNSILDMSKLQSGSFALMPEPFDIAPLIDLCCDMTKLKACEGDVELIRAYPGEIPEIMGDKQACKQIVINLLSNAIKFTPPGGRVTIGVQPEGNSLAIRVTDTGIGINAQDLTQIGDPFFQASASYNRAYDGTGLGLSIVRGLVALHGGTIAIESEPGKGTCVYLRLPRDCRQVRVKTHVSAEFVTIPRRTRPDDVRSFSNEMMVKKIA